MEAYKTSLPRWPPFLLPLLLSAFAFTQPWTTGLPYERIRIYVFSFMGKKYSLRFVANVRANIRKFLGQPRSLESHARIIAGQKS